MQKMYSVIDIETTGSHKNGNKITEIAIINFDGEKIIEKYQTLINPEMSIPYWITKLTGINDDMVAKAPKFYEVAKKIVEMTEGNIFVAHNVFFDYNFLKHEFSELGFNFRRDKLCTVRLARQFLPGHASYSLGKICHDLNIPLTSRHRAMGDALATVELLRKCLEKNCEINLVESKNQLALPSHLDREEFEKLPQLPGVYYFYDKMGELLYIGKSKDIYKRVATHFRPDMKRKKDIQLKNLVAKIDYKLTGNELAALLVECHEIKEFYPPFNHALKRKRFPIAIKLELSKSGELKIKATHKSEDDNSFYQASSKNAAKRIVSKLYLAIVGHEPETLLFDQAKLNLQATLGMENYNALVEKVYYAKKFKKEKFVMKLKGRSQNETCLIHVSDHHPREISYLDDENELPHEVIHLKSDQDMRNILLHWNGE